MTPLERMQEESKKRHSAFKGIVPTIMEKENIQEYEPVQDERTIADFFKEQEEIKYIEPTPEIYDAPPVTPINDELPKTEEPKVDYSKLKKFVKPIVDKCKDEPLKFQRPKAEYSNRSPYGIASDLHFGKDI